MRAVGSERDIGLTPIRVGVAAGCCIFLIYLATLAPGVTFWDSGELIAAVHSFGIPHPPGAPLYITCARAWSILLAGISETVAVNSFSAVCTAAAVGCLGWLLARWSGWGWGALAGALAAGASSTIWLAATEAEVYAASLLVAVLSLVAAEHAAQRPGGGSFALIAYLFGLAVPLHLSILVAAPAVCVRVWAGDCGRRLPGPALALFSVAIAAAAAGRGSIPFLVLAAVLMVVATGISRRGERRSIAGTWPAALLAISAVAILPVRAGFDPLINSGNPVSLGALQQVITRAQYDVAGLWPRQAPPWIQLANLAEYADWQWALGLGPDVMPTVGRTATTIVFALLGIAGARAHWRKDREKAAVMLTLIVCGSIGVAAYMNFKAGASFGWGVLLDELPHEPRDRDYFFVLAFAAWGGWAGMGAAALLRRWRGAAPLALAAGVAPLVLNWPVTSRKLLPNALLPARVADALLWSAPPGAVVITGGDNDSFPIWYAQTVHGARPDVRVVVAPLLGADWYRAELARRDSLLPAQFVSKWYGERATLESIAHRARTQGRPVALALTLQEERWVLEKGNRTLRGLLLVEDSSAVRRPSTVPDVSIDSVALVAYARHVAPILALGPPRPSPDPAPRVMQTLLACPLQIARAARAGADSSSLAQPCRLR